MRCGTPFLAGDPADEGHHRPWPGRPRVRESTDSLGLGWGRVPDVGVDAVLDHVHPGRVQRRVRRQHVVAHAGTHRDHRIGGLHGGALHPQRHLVAAAELFGLPRPQRFQRMRRQHVRDAVQQRGEMPGHAGVPGVRMHHRRIGGGIGHPKVRRQRRQRGVGVLAARGRADGRTRPGAAPPMQCTSTSHRWRNWATSSVTCTPAPP